MPTIAFSMAPAGGPLGGASGFLWQLESTLRRRGYRVTHRLDRSTDLVFVIDPRMDHPLKRFGLQELTAFREARPEVPILHRINECDARKGTYDIDNLLWETNELADYTVFISEWLREYFEQEWFDPARPHSVIYNGADSRIFHPFGNHEPEPSEPFKIVTHHWSHHELKGFDVYRELDDLIANLEIDGVEFTYIGNWPQDLDWKATRAMKPMSGRKLAEELRAHHIYITASRWEPCGMHHVEGAQCGLPLLYHEEGGGIVEAGLRYGIGFTDDLIGALQEMAERYHELRTAVRADPPSGDRMTLEYVELIQLMLALCDAER